MQRRYWLSSVFHERSNRTTPQSISHNRCFIENVNFIIVIRVLQICLNDCDDDDDDDEIKLIGVTFCSNG